MKVGDLVEYDMIKEWKGVDNGKMGVVLSISVPTPSNPLMLAIVQFGDARRECNTRYLKVISERESA